MSTWNVITITEAPGLTERKMQKALDRAGVDLSDLTLDQGDDGWKVCGHSKYEAEGIYRLAKDITHRHPGARAEVFQEWDTRDADEPGQSLDVYTGGEYQAARARVSGLVPSDLAKSIADVRAALDGSGDLAAASLWLVNGLDGER